MAFHDCWRLVFGVESVSLPDWPCCELCITVGFFFLFVCFTSNSTKIRPFLPHLLPFLPPFIHVFTTTVQTCRCGRFLLDLYKRAVSPLLIFFFFFSIFVSLLLSHGVFFFFFLSLKLCFDEEEEKKDTKRKTTSVLSIRKRKTNMWNIPENGDCLRSVSLDDPACIKEKRKKILKKTTKQNSSRSIHAVTPAFLNTVFCFSFFWFGSVFLVF